MIRCCIVFVLVLAFFGQGIVEGKTTQSKKGRPATSQEAKKRQQEAQKDIQLTEAQLKENEREVKRNLNELGKVEGEIAVNTKKIEELTSKINKLSNEISSLELGISENESELNKLREEYLKAVKKMRVARKNRSELAFIFSSKSFVEAARRMRYLREFSAWRIRQTDAIDAHIEDLKRRKKELAKAKDEQQSALVQQRKSREELKDQQKRQETLVAELKQNGAALESHLQRKRAEAKELGVIVSQLIAEETRKAEEARIAEEKRKAEEALRESERRRAEEAQKTKEQDVMLAQSDTGKEVASEKNKSKDKGKNENKKASGNKSGGKSGSAGKDVKSPENGKAPVEYAAARNRTPRSKKDVEQVAGFSDMRGKLPVPTTGKFEVTSHFGRQSFSELQGVEYENPGIDAETDSGASARAVYEGTVSGVYLLPGYDTVVIVNHEGYYTVYGNIASPAVKSGDAVNAGSLLGKLSQSDDNPSKCVIHFEVWKGREKQNPETWLR